MPALQLTHGNFREGERGDFAGARIACGLRVAAELRRVAGRTQMNHFLVRKRHAQTIRAVQCGNFAADGAEHFFNLHRVVRLGAGFELRQNRHALFRGKIFQKFAQAEQPATRRHGGTGLGLSITKELVERMGGQIGFFDTEGHGASFWFELSDITIDATESPVTISGNNQQT